MKRIFLLVVLLTICISQTMAQRMNLNGIWQFCLGDGDIFQRVTLEHRGDSISGVFFGQNFIAKLNKKNLRFSIGSDFTYEGVIKDEFRIDGNFRDREGTVTPWSARKEKMEATSAFKAISPSRFYREFSGRETPCARLNSGDTVSTFTIDASGSDQNSKKANWGGNPLTGPFYVENAIPGDMIALKFIRICTNRDWAFSGREIVESVLEPRYAAQAAGERIDNGWMIQKDSGYIRMYNPPRRLKNYRIPLRPFLGCVGVSPPARAAISSQLSGAYGGNMDDNFLQEGVTLYLPVFTPGAHLFIGDAHAAQGDGEVSGSAMETSMDVVFTATLIRGANINTPRMEDSAYIRSVGIAGSLDKAIKIATTDLARWLTEKYGLTKAELAPLLGFSLEYEIPDMVGESISVAAKIRKDVLRTLIE